IQKNKVIRKRDLVYSWFIWKNFSHSCYSYERLMGMAFAHSMKNIFKKLYKDKNIIREAIHNHAEFFNTEPNMGTPIHGYIIALEEERMLNNQSFDQANISYIKKGMMGIAAGLGDSFTQVVLTPLFISMSLMLCLDGSYYLALLPISLLALYIIIISYRGFIKGYYDGRSYLVERIKSVNNSKVKKYFPYMFSASLGSSMGNFMFNNIRAGESILTLLIIFAGALYTFIKRRG
ncbi:MAG: PTS system mannose/fructose/sorbose family transporter subunit IID, partial [Tissierellia bacterium]|nr:PTS system mannose/fructose/sorbose family transporter subunit IID [Tissierellia bacterium]